jgi:predicted anti-sigma-YlaC factor YlaD
MSGWNCEKVQESIPQLLDGELTGREMQQIDAHARQCLECTSEVNEWKTVQKALRSLPAVQAPPDMGLRLRVALSQARARANSNVWDRWELMWQNSLRPLALQCSAGLASALAVVIGIGLLVGVFAAPQGVQASSAKDEPLGMATAPHFLYSMLPNDALATQINESVVVEVFLGADGRVYDYKILAGPDTPQLRSQLNNVLYFSVFAPARVFGQPVRGHAVLSYAGVAVRG